MGRKVTKNPSWIQFTDEVWGEAIGPSKHDSFLDSLDDPELPASALEPLPDANAPLLLTWMVEQAREQIEDERRRVIGPHGPTFAKHADMQMEVANLDAARRAATGDLRDQITRQHREAKQELDDFERGDRFQKALQHYLEARGPAFERIAAATPMNQAAVVHQQQAAERHDGLKALSRCDNGDTPPVQDKPLAPLVQVKAFQDDAGTDGLVAWQAEMLESWQDITKAYSGKPTARNAMQWLKKNGPRDTFPEQQPDRNALRWLDRDGNHQTVQYKSVATRISEWRAAGKIPT